MLKKQSKSAKRSAANKAISKSKLREVTDPLISILIVLLIWEWVIHTFDISLYILPAPSDILNAVRENAQVLWSHSVVTLSEALIGLMLAAISAFAIAILMDMFKICKSVSALNCDTNCPGDDFRTAVCDMVRLWDDTENYNGDFHVLFSNCDILL